MHTDTNTSILFLYKDISYKLLCLKSHFSFFQFDVMFAKDQFNSCVDRCKLYYETFIRKLLQNKNKGKKKLNI